MRAFTFSILRAQVSGVTGKYFWGQSHFSRFFPGVKSLFPIFSRRDFSLFPLKISILVDPKKVSLVLRVKSKKTKQKQKQKSSAFSVIFHLTFFFSFFHSSSFSSTFPIFTFFYLPHYSRLVAKNFPLESLGAPCPPPPTCYATGPNGP